jgi:redox-sensitive bicupin YhaK (pirin superfamily)
MKCKKTFKNNFGCIFMRHLGIKRLGGGCMATKIKKQFSLSFHWEAQDPFLFLAHHHDLYPAGNAQMGPVANLGGRNMGNDFDLNNDFKMYHGYTVPGFPAHPHRGFETVTIVLEGYVDHFDSSGASGRYGDGDVQWMTAGKGMQHCEMFPCLHDKAPNPLELFQIWLNLPKARKFVEPYYKMLWSETVPFQPIAENDREVAKVKVIAGEIFENQTKCPAPDSVASDDDAEVVIALIDIKANETLTLAAVPSGVERTLYFYQGEQIVVDGEPVNAKTGMMLTADALTLKNGAQTAKCLLLQGRPIGEPVAAYGPFVMNTRAEITEAYEDYQKTRFGGWPWEKADPVHPRNEGRIAKYADGTSERP